MDYEEDGVSDGLPIFGAIFMSNIATKKECFEHRVLGLPVALANFVKQVKVGMLLFLFEFERRELHGVFQASSDGAMNIVPHAFSSTGKQFPAQVCFTQLWHCSPLSKDEFRDAIKENYFSRKKFNFGLTEDQVRRLLWLFSTRKLVNMLYPRQFPTPSRKSVKKNKRMGGTDWCVLQEWEETEKEEDRIEPAISMKYLETPSRMSDKFLQCVRTGNEVNEGKHFGSDILREGYLGKRRKDDLGSFSTRNGVEFSNGVNHDLAEVVRTDFPRHSLKDGRIDDNSQFLLDHVSETETEGDDNIGPVVAPNYQGSSFAKCLTDGRFLIRNKGGRLYTGDNGSGVFISTDHHNNDEDKRRLLMDNVMENDANLNSGIDPIISSANQCANHLDKRIRESGNSKLLVTEAMVSESDEYNAHGQIVQGKLLWSPLDHVKRASNAGRFSIGGWMDDEHHVGSARPIILPERFTNYQDIVGRTSSHERFLTNASRNVMGSGLVPKFSTVLTPLRHTTVSPSVYPNKSMLETGYSFSQGQHKPCSGFPNSTEQKKFVFSYPTSHDAVVTRAVPCDPKLPDVYQRRSAFTEADCTCTSLQKYSPSAFPVVDLPSTIKPVHHIKAEDLSQHIDGVGKFSLSTDPYCRNHLVGKASNPVADLRNYRNSQSQAISRHVYEDPLLPECSSASIPFTSTGTYQWQKTCCNQHAGSFLSQEIDESDMLKGETNQASENKVIPLYDENTGYLNCSSAPQGLFYFEEDSESHGSEHHQYSSDVFADSKSERTSVFDRLSLAPEVCPEETDTYLGCNQYNMDASVDEIMEQLCHSLKRGTVKVVKSSPFNWSNTVEETHRIKKWDVPHKHVFFNKLTVAKNMIQKNDMQTVKKDGNKLVEDTRCLEFNCGSEAEIRSDVRAVEKECDKLVEETRCVEFKRRSETKKKMDPTTTIEIMEEEKKFPAQKAEDDGSESKQQKRRKLVRPVFGKKERSDEVMGVGDLGIGQVEF